MRKEEAERILEEYLKPVLGFALKRCTLTVYRRDYFTVKYFSGTSIWVDPMYFPGSPMI